MKTSIEEPSYTGNLNKVFIRFLFTCYFVNTPHMLNDGSILLPFYRNPVFFFKTLRLYTPNIRIMSEKFSILT